MAEVLGLVSAILTLAGAGANLGMTLYTIADGVGSAGREARLIADEVSLFSQALTALSKSLERRTSQSARLHIIAQELSESCQAALVELSALAKDLSLSGGKKRRKLPVLVAKIKWMLQKPTVAFLRSSISSFKSTLILLVASMDYTEAVDRYAPDSICGPLRTQVESLIETGKTASLILVESHKLLEAPSRPRTTSTEPLLIDFDESQEIDSAPSLETDYLSDASSDATEVEHLLPIEHNFRANRLVMALACNVLHRQNEQGQWSWEGSSFDGAPPQKATHARSAVPGFNESPWKPATSTAPPTIASQDTESPFTYQTETGYSPNTHSGTVAAGTAERTTNRASQFGVQAMSPEHLNDLERITKLENMIQNLHTDFASGEPKDRLSGLEQRLRALDGMRQKTPAQQPVESDGVQRLAELERRVREMEAPSEETSWRDPRATIPQQNEEIERLKMLVLRYEEAKAASERAEAATKMKDEAADAKRSQELWEKKYRELQAEMERNKPAEDALKAPIKFKDAVGRKFSFPWHLCKTWKGMENLIKQAFMHVDGIGEQVYEGHYDLTGPDGEIILPQVWDTMIQPDWEIKMHMWPMPEPKKEKKPLVDPLTGFFDGLGFPDPQQDRPKKEKRRKSRPKSPDILNVMPLAASAMDGSSMPPPPKFALGMRNDPTALEKEQQSRPKSIKSKELTGLAAWISGGRRKNKSSDLTTQSYHDSLKPVTTTLDTPSLVEDRNRRRPSGLAALTGEKERSALLPECRKDSIMEKTATDLLNNRSSTRKATRQRSATPKAGRDARYRNKAREAHGADLDEEEDEDGWASAEASDQDSTAFPPNFDSVIGSQLGNDVFPMERKAKVEDVTDEPV
ncbi:hypothetical protein LTR56_020494 [Elasticomyces elasticus]|nr:hypothetical protein LTR56_020494 [Elasticomyces elasticus]KAK4910176.1 hypothetical protein LTR49_021142 [Elasticomyces elasticus]KAK5766391.1 hypothetical protein LTS12_003308 [Elasticomyces elasticus]